MTSAVKVLLATGNVGKLAELERILSDEMAGSRVQLLGLRDVEPYPMSPESGLTFAENALLKAREAVQATGLPSIADDSGLAVDALNGMPGIFSARWCGRHGDDQANLELLLGQIGDVPDEHRSAAFVCVAALALPDGREQVAEGRMPGRVIRAPRGSNGFGYDPIFIADGLELTNAELSSVDKDRISHRGQAFRELSRILAGLLRTD